MNEYKSLDRVHKCVRESRNIGLQGQRVFVQNLVCETSIIRFL